MREPNTICVCSATKGALVNDFPCLHWSTAGVGGGLTMDKASREGRLKAREPGSIPVLCLLVEFVRLCFQFWRQQTDMSTPFQPLDHTGSTGGPKTTGADGLIISKLYQSTPPPTQCHFKLREIFWKSEFFLGSLRSTAPPSPTPVAPCLQKVWWRDGSSLTSFWLLPLDCDLKQQVVFWNKRVPHTEHVVQALAWTLISG